MNENLLRMTRELRLSGMGSSLDLRIQEARGGNLDYEEFLELVLQDEINVRHSGMIKRRIKNARIKHI